jgi:hypothetical protein
MVTSLGTFLRRILFPTMRCMRMIHLQTIQKGPDILRIPAIIGLHAKWSRTKLCIRQSSHRVILCTLESEISSIFGRLHFSISSLSSHHPNASINLFHSCRTRKRLLRLAIVVLGDDGRPRSRPVARRCT